MLTLPGLGKCRLSVKIPLPKVPKAYLFALFGQGQYQSEVPEKMRVLLACEESQAVTIELRKRGIEAFSCDTLPCSGGRPEWHIQGDVAEVLNDGWDMMLAFPPCTYLTVTGNRWFNVEKYGDTAKERYN